MQYTDVSYATFVPFIFGMILANAKLGPSLPPAKNVPVSLGIFLA